MAYSTAALLEDTLEEKMNFKEFLLMFLLLLVTGNPYFVHHFSTLIIPTIVIPLYYIFKKSYRQISYRTVFIIFFMLGYEVVHALMFTLDYSFTIIKLAIVLLLALSTVMLLGERFIKVLTGTMVVITLISFVFTILCYIPGISTFLYHLAEDLFPIEKDFKHFTTPTLLVYTFSYEYFYGEFSYVRNPAIFWESGAFAVFLNITLYLHYITKNVRHVRDLFDRPAAILILGVLSTTSTMGFFALVVILTFFTFQLRTQLKFLFLILVVVSSWFAYNNVEYLGAKINQQISEGDTRNNRFNAALRDMEDISKRPLLGWSRRIEVLFKTKEHSQKTRRPNGLTNFIRCYGLVYFTIYFVLVFTSFSNITKFYNGYSRPGLAFFGIILLWIVSFSELLFDLPFFKALVFLYSAYYPYLNAREEKILAEAELTTTT